MPKETNDQASKELNKTSAEVAPAQSVVPAPAVAFSDTATAAKFVCLGEHDIMVHKAGVYSGRLSKITPAMAEAMVKQKSNLIKLK